MSDIVDVRRETTEELAALFEEEGHGLTSEQMSRNQEPIRRLEVAPNAFQFRDPNHREGEKEYHVRKLVQALERQEGYFDPLLLFAVDGHRIVLDGHCRLQAYLRADLEADTEIPVRYFQGAFSEALTRPASENSKRKLALTQRERLEAAWKLVCFDEQRGNYSLRHIARAAGCGKSTVGNMRQVLREEEGLVAKRKSMTWVEVKDERKEAREVDPDWEEKVAEKMRRAIRRALADQPNKTPQCFFRALEEGYPQLIPQMIPREWAEDSGIVNELATEFEDFEF